MKINLDLQDHDFSDDFIKSLQHHLINSPNITLGKLRISNLQHVSKERLYNFLFLIQKNKIEKIDFSSEESDDDFVEKSLNYLINEPNNKLIQLFFGKISSFAFKFISDNIYKIKNLHYIGFEEKPNDLFSNEDKQKFIESIKSNSNSLIYIKNVFVKDTDQEIFIQFVNLNKFLRKKYLNQYEENIINKQFQRNAFDDIKNFEQNRIKNSFSTKNYIDSVFGSKLEDSIFEIKKLQEKTLKQIKKIENNCNDEPKFVIDHNIFTSDGFFLLLSKKLINKFGHNLSSK